jgi:hypothetical protein
MCMSRQNIPTSPASGPRSKIDECGDLWFDSSQGNGSVGDGGLREMHALGGARETLGSRDRNEAAQKIRGQPVYHEAL